MRYLLTFLLLALVDPVTATPQSNDLDKLIERLAVIENPGFGKYEITRKRFRYLASQIAEQCNCEDVQAINVMVYVYSEIREKGTADTMIELFESYQRMIKEVNTIHLLQIEDFEVNIGTCSELAGMYVVLRPNYRTYEEAKKQTVGVIRALLKIANKP